MPKTRLKIRRIKTLREKWIRENKTIGRMNALKVDCFYQLGAEAHQRFSTVKLLFDNK